MIDAANGRRLATTPVATLHLDPDTLRALVQQVVGEVLAQAEAAQPKLNGKLAYDEREAAALLGLQQHTLRDERLRGRIAASHVVGRRVRYLREDLLRYLLERRTGEGG